MKKKYAMPHTRAMFVSKPFAELPEEDAVMNRKRYYHDKYAKRMQRGWIADQKVVRLHSLSK